MAIVTDLLDRLKSLQADRAAWDSYCIDIAAYVLPDAERFDAMFSGPVSGPTGIVRGGTAIDSVVSEPIAAKRGRQIYDMTSLMAIDRGAAGTLALVTPQSETWHDLETSDPFGEEPSDEERRWQEKLRDFLFRTRGNPRSGFWTAQKAAMRATWAFGWAVLYIEESDRGIASPISYRYVPISECYLGCDFEGNVDTNFRLFTRSAAQCVQKWGGTMSAKVQAMAADEKRKDQLVTILHAVYPRKRSGGPYLVGSNLDAPFASCYVEVGEKRLISESGFEEFPYRIDHWQRNNPGPYSEGPVAVALPNIKSLNAMAKNRLRAIQQWTDPPTATPDDNLNRINLNPRANNPGYVNADGKPMIVPIITSQRPDLAEQALETERGQTRDVLYVNLWQILISNPNMTATEAMIRANEKGDLLGPVGTSLQTGLSFQVDREIAILGRRGAFSQGSPLEPPQSMRGKDVGVRFTSPLDRMRRLPQLQGMTQLISIGAQLEQVKPGTMDKIDADAMLDEAQEILGAPRSVMTSDADLEAIRSSRKQQADAASGIALAHGAGNAAQAVGAGGQALADSPAAADILRRVAGLGQAA